MNLHRNVLISVVVFLLSCSSAQDNNDISRIDSSSAANAADSSSAESIQVYGLIKVDSGKIFIIADWKSRSMITYTIVGSKAAELADNNGGYALVRGVLTKKQRWSGTIEVESIISIDESPDPRKEKTAGFIKNKTAE